MTLLELFIIAVGLSMDAFAVSVCKGLSLQKMRLRHALWRGFTSVVFRQPCPFSAICWALSFRMP